MRTTTILATALLALFTARQANAAGGTTPLPLRYEANGVYVHNGVTSQTLESSFGTNLLGLAFTGTNTYDFYSPPLLSPVTLTTTYNGGGVVAMTNTAPSSANDFQAGAMMIYYDYDPITGVDTLVANAGQAISPPQNITHGKMTVWTLIQNPLAANYTIPAGHLVHLSLIVNRISGNPGNFGQVLYNGPSGSTSIGLLPQNASLPLGWPLGSVATSPPSITSITALADPAVRINCTGAPGSQYLIQATTNLNSPSSWVTISTNTADTNGLFQLVDSDAPYYSCRFYRAKTP